MVAVIKGSFNLSTLKKGDQGIISSISNENMASRLMAMGILPDSKVTMIRKAPFGGGCYIKVDNLFIALRQIEARSILLK